MREADTPRRLAGQNLLPGSGPYESSGPGKRVDGAQPVQSTMLQTGGRLFHTVYLKSRTVVATKKQTTKPIANGMSALSAVHFPLRVSFQIVRMVVEHGLCSSEKSIRQAAVSSVQL